MKPIASTMTEVDNLPGEEVEFTISDANKAWVMRSMADLYSNRELACVREYSTNAYDSNKEKALRDGHEIRPIEVTLPTPLNPYFTVQDRGVGMSEQTLKRTYTQFGESTKRDSDDYNGMLGFGSKSAVAYTNTFTVTSVHQGRKTVAVVTRREDAMGGYLLSLKVILSVDTSEEDGVSVQIPVHNSFEFERKALDFYRYWKPGTVLINGREPDWAVGEKIAEGLYLNTHAGTSYVVMGNVPYRIANPNALFPAGMNRISFVAYVEPCDCDFAADTHSQVEFTPSREDLKYSEHTKHHLHKIINDFVDTSVQTAKDEIAKATTHSEAYKTWAKWRRIIGSGQVDDLTFKGDQLVDDFKIGGWRYDISAYRYGTWTMNSWHVGEMENTIIVTNFTPADIASSHKKKAKEWKNIKNITARYILFTPEAKISSPWVPDERVVTWEQMKADVPKAPRKPRANNPVGWGRKAGSFDLISKNGKKVEQDVPASKELYYIMVQDFKKHQELPTVLAEFNLDHEVVLLPANRRDKFLRHYPHAKEVMPMLEGLVEYNGNKLLNKDAKTYLSLDSNERSALAALDDAEVNDPAIKELIRICKIPDDKHLAEYSKHHRLARLLGKAHSFKQHDYRDYWNAPKNRPLSDKYPLVAEYRLYRRQSDETKKHAHIYMNAVYAARKDGKNV